MNLQHYSTAILLQFRHVYVTLADTDSVEEAIANNHQKLTKLGGQLVHISVDRVYSKDQQFSSRKYPAGHMNRPESPPLSHRGRSSSRYEDLRHSDRFQRASSVGRSLGRLAEEIPPRHFERSRSIGRDIPPEFGGYESHQSRRRDPPGRNSSYPEHFSTHKRVRSPSIHQRHGGYDNDFRPQSKYIRSEMASNSYRRERDYPPQPYCPPTGYYQESR